MTQSSPGTKSSRWAIGAAAMAAASLLGVATLWATTTAEISELRDQIARSQAIQAFPEAPAPMAAGRAPAARSAATGSPQEALTELPHPMKRAPSNAAWLASAKRNLAAQKADPSKSAALQERLVDLAAHKDLAAFVEGMTGFRAECRKSCLVEAGFKSVGDAEDWAGMYMLLASDVFGQASTNARRNPDGTVTLYIYGQ